MYKFVLVVALMWCCVSSAKSTEYYSVCGKVTDVASSGGRVGIGIDSVDQGKMGVDVWIGEAKPTSSDFAATQRILTVAESALANNLKFCIGSEIKPRPADQVHNVPGLLQVRTFDSLSVSK